MPARLVLFFNYCSKRYELYVAAFLKLLQVQEESFSGYVSPVSCTVPTWLHSTINEAKNFFMAILFKLDQFDALLISRHKSKRGYTGITKIMTNGVSG